MKSSAPRASATVARPFAKRLTDRISIFVVEDSDIYRELIKRFIFTIDRNFLVPEESDFEIRSFRSGEECIANLHQKPDIVVLDYFLNGYSNSPEAMDGLETLKLIKQMSPRTHVVVVTSNGQLYIASELIRHGASDYISKEPGVREKLQHSISRLIHTVRKEREAEKDKDKGVN